MTFTVKLPILGFEHITTLVLNQIDDFFMRLYDEDSDTTFTLINPFAIREYTFDIPLVTRALLDIKNEDQALLIFNIVIVQTPLENSTINFIAPLLFNTKNKTMAQVILDSHEYPNFDIADKISKYLYSEKNQ